MCHKAHQLGLMGFATLLGLGPKSGERSVVILKPMSFFGALLVVGCNLAQHRQTGCQLGLRLMRDEDVARLRQTPSQLECHTCVCVPSAAERTCSKVHKRPPTNVATAPACSGGSAGFGTTKTRPAVTFCTSLAPNAHSALWARTIFAGVVESGWKYMGWSSQSILELGLAPMRAIRL